MENKDVTELHIQQADIAIDAIDALPKKIMAMADAITRMPGMELISFNDWNDFIGSIEDACNDLFAKPREKLCDLAGDRPEPNSMYKTRNMLLDAIVDALNPASNPFIVKPFTNPSTYAAMGEPL